MFPRLSWCRARRNIRRAASVVAGLCAIAMGAPASANAGVVPTQWIAKVTTESLGRAPFPGGWNTWVNYYSSGQCTAATLAAFGKDRYKSGEFLGRRYDNAERMLSLYRGALNREPRESEVRYLLPSLNSGATSWQSLVDGVFSSAEFQALAPTICSTATAGYGFDQAPAGDLKDWAGSGPSRTQKELQDLLDAAKSPTCGTVELKRKEVIPIGGDQPGTQWDNNPLRIPPCVTLTTETLTTEPSPIVRPDAQHYASMGRLVPNGLICDAPWLTCEHIELVRMGGDRAKLSNVWIDGKGLPSSNHKIGLVGIGSGTQGPTEVTDNRLSDPPPDGTAVRAAGYGTTGAACAGRFVSRNLVTGYATDHAQTQLGKARWADGLSIFCEQATVQDNDIIDISDAGIVVYGSWNSATGEHRTQRSTVSDNVILSAGNSAHVALGADAVGECLADRDGPPVSCIEFSHDRPDPPRPPKESERDFTGTLVRDNTFWTGARTHFDIGLMIGSAPMWGDNGPRARGASFTGNTVDIVPTTRVHTGIAVGGMSDTVLAGNTSSYNWVDGNPDVTEGKCPQGDVLHVSSTFKPSPTPQPSIERPSLYHCFAPNPPAGGMERIKVGPGQTLVGENSGQRFNPWGRNDGIYETGVDHKIDVSELRETKQMGANVVRLNLQFKDMMSKTPGLRCTTPDQNALAELRDTLRRAEENGMYLDLTGPVSYWGDDQDPPCYRGASQEERWASQERLLRAVAETAAGSPAVLAFDVMNEPMVPPDATPSVQETPCWAGPEPPGPPADPYCGTSFVGYFFPQNITRTPIGPASDTGRAWLTRMKSAIRAHDPNHLITLGCLPTLTCAGLTATDMASLLDYLSIHIYPRDCTGEAPPPPAADPCVVHGDQRSVENMPGAGPLTHELDLLQNYAAAGDPVVVEETFPPNDSPLVRNFILDSRPYATGWLGAWGHRTLSQEIADPDRPPLTDVWGRTFQRLTKTVAPCGTCQP